MFEALERFVSYWLVASRPVPLGNSNSFCGNAKPIRSRATLTQILSRYRRLYGRDFTIIILLCDQIGADTYKGDFYWIVYMHLFDPLEVTADREKSANTGQAHFWAIEQRRKDQYSHCLQWWQEYGYIYYTIGKNRTKKDFPGTAKIISTNSRMISLT